MSTATVRTRLGPVTVTAGPEGITGVGFSDAGLRVSDAATGAPSTSAGLAAQTAAAIARYVDDGAALPAAPIDPAIFGDGFSGRVLAALQDLPVGETTTYRALAVRVGRPGAARAVGNVLARNPVPILLPCHRVIRSDGRVSRYLGEADMTRRALLLDLDARLAATDTVAQSGA